MISNDAVALVSALDLEPIKTKLMHKESGEGWSLEHATAVEAEYRRFLYLAKVFPNEDIAPLVDVDTFWHYHILDTMKYARDCEQVFGYFKHHYPYLGLVGENGIEMQQHSGDRTRELYESSFGESYARAAGAPQEVTNSASYGRAPAAALQTTWYAGRGVKATDTQTAWCIGPSVKAADGKTAWCMGPGVKAADATTAYCLGPGVKAADAKTAWCIGPGVKTADTRTAWCIGPGVKASDAQTA
ncbi:glycine-rich domain-containing protein [Massilia sp. SYSU DXS3249]